MARGKVEALAGKFATTLNIDPAVLVKIKMRVAVRPYRALEDRFGHPVVDTMLVLEISPRCA